MLATVEEMSSNGDSPGTLSRRKAGGHKENGEPLVPSPLVLPPYPVYSCAITGASPSHTASSSPTKSPVTPSKDSVQVTSMRTKRMSTG